MAIYLFYWVLLPVNLIPHLVCSRNAIGLLLFMLSNLVDNFRASYLLGCDEEQIATALGHVCHVMVMISHWLEVLAV